MVSVLSNVGPGITQRIKKDVHTTKSHKICSSLSSLSHNNCTWFYTLLLFNNIFLSFLHKMTTSLPLSRMSLTPPPILMSQDFKEVRGILYFHALEKEMATHSSVLAWRIPGMVEPGGLPSMGSHRVGHD